MWAASISFVIRLFALSAACAWLGCGSAVASDCAVSGKASAQLQIEVPAVYAAGELVIRGDCQQFSCLSQANGGCVLWQGEISLDGSAACQITLYAADKIVASAWVTGSDACATPTKKVALGE